MTECLICFDSPCNRDRSVELTCCAQSNSWIHASCMRQLFDSTNRRQCPHCRRDISVETVRIPGAHRRYICHCHPYWCCGPFTKSVIGLLMLTLFLVGILAIYGFSYYQYHDFYNGEQCNLNQCWRGYIYPSDSVKAASIVTLIVVTLFLLFYIVEYLVYVAFTCGASTRCCTSAVSNQGFMLFLTPARILFWITRARDHDTPIEYILTRLYTNLCFRYLITIILAVCLITTEVIGDHTFYVYLPVLVGPIAVYYLAMVILSVSVPVYRAIRLYFKRGVQIEEVGQHRQVIVANIDPFHRTIPPYLTQSLPPNPVPVNAASLNSHPLASVSVNRSDLASQSPIPVSSLTSASMEPDSNGFVPVQSLSPHFQFSVNPVPVTMFELAQPVFDSP